MLRTFCGQFWRKRTLKKNSRTFTTRQRRSSLLLMFLILIFLWWMGRGDPNTSQDYKDAIEALFSTSYTLKFMIKKGKMAIDYGVLPLESLWWADEPTRFSLENKSNWNWTAMIMQPKFITDALVNEALEQVKKKKSPIALSKLRFQNFKEGLSRTDSVCWSLFRRVADNRKYAYFHQTERLRV